MATMVRFSRGSDGRWYSYQFAKNGRNLMQPINAPSAPQANGGGAPVTVSPFRGVSQADTRPTYRSLIKEPRARPHNQ